MKAIRATERILGKINIVLAGLAGAIVVGDALAVSADVTSRFLFNKTFEGVVEFTEYSMVWITFLGAAWLLELNGHVRVDLVVNMLNPRRKMVMNIIASVIALFPLAVMLWYTAGITLHDYVNGIVFASVIELPKWPVEIIIPIGSFLLLLQALLKAGEALTDWRAQPRQAQPQAPQTAP